jgi:hypothetical protein
MAKETFSEMIRKISTQELEQKLASGEYGSDSDPYHRLVELELRQRIEKANEIKFNKTLALTRNLVKATWGLVIITALLVLAALMPVIIKGCG